MMRDGCCKVGEQKTLNELLHLESEICVLRLFVLKMFAWIAGLPGRISRNYVYFVQMVTILCLFFAELLLFGNFVLDQGLRLCLWALLPTYRLAPHVKHVPEGISWFLVVFPLGLVIIPRIAISRWKSLFVDLLVWDRHPDQHNPYFRRRDTALLNFLRAEARLEQRRNHDWKRLTRGAGEAVTSEEAMPLTISKDAGWWSFLYVTLSNFMGMAPAPGESIEDEMMTVSALPTHTAPQTTNPQAWVPPPYGLCLLGTVIFRIGQLQGHVRNPRQQELLAYLAQAARERPVVWTNVVTASYGVHLSEEDPEVLRKKLDDDVKALRKLFERLCRQAGLPYINPIQVDGHGRGSTYRLADAYVVADIRRMEWLVEQLRRIKQGEVDHIDLQIFREECDAVRQSYAEGFLGQQRREKMTGEWVDAYYIRYRTMYQQLLLDSADYEYAVGKTQQDEERKVSFKRAVDLYEQYVLVTSALLSEKVRPEGQTLLNEHALRQCMTISGLLGDVSSARRVYAQFVKTVTRRLRDWQPEPQTVQVYEEVTRASEDE
jgi:hypothetical protein